MRKLGWLVAALVLALLSGAADAGTADAGTVRARSPAGFAGWTEISDSALSVVYDDANGEDFAFRIEAERATLVRYECPVGPYACEERDRVDLADVRIGLEGARSVRIDATGVDGAVGADDGELRAGVASSLSYQSGVPALPGAFTFSADKPLVAELEGALKGVVQDGRVVYDGRQAGTGKPAIGDMSAEPGFVPTGDAYVVLEASGATLESTGSGFATAERPVVRAESARFAPAAGAVPLASPVALRAERSESKDGEHWIHFSILADVGAPVIPANARPSDDEGFAREAGVAALAAGIVAAGAAAWYWPSLRYLVTVPLLPLYSRIERGAVMEHETRERIYQLIRETPGIHAHEISARASVGWGTAVYHLKMLEDHRLVVSERQGRYKRFFLAAGYTATKDAIGALRNPTTSAVAEFISRNPGAMQREVCAAVGISASLVSWHIEKLESADLVKKVREGRTVRYFAGPAWSAVASTLAAPAATAAANN